MNSKDIKHKIAVSCNGNLNKYFQEVAIVNKFLFQHNQDVSHPSFLRKLKKVRSFTWLE